MKHDLRITFHHTSDISTLLLTHSMNLLVSFLHALVDKVSVLVFSYNTSNVTKRTLCTQTRLLVKINGLTQGSKSWCLSFHFNLVASLRKDTNARMEADTSANSSASDEIHMTSMSSRCKGFQHQILTCYRSKNRETKVIENTIIMYLVSNRCPFTNHVESVK